MTIEARFHIIRNGFHLDVDLKIPGSGITAVFGPSGCGKTTLLRAIAGLEKHKFGFLKVGESIWQDEFRFTPSHKRSLGYIFQEPSLFDHLNVQENIEYGYKRLSPSRRRTSLDQIIEILGIGPLLNRKTDSISGGERQRVALARSFAVSPGLLLMDEPLSALDEKLKQDIYPYIESLTSIFDTPVIYVTHSHDEVTRLADHLILLENGRVISEGSINEMLTKENYFISQNDQPRAVIQAVVSGYDDQYELTILGFAGGSFLVPGKNIRIGTDVRLRIFASDVSLTLERQKGTSIQNIFYGVVDHINTESKNQATVRILISGEAILSRITLKSLYDLKLHPGQKVYAQIKSVALLI